MQTAIRAMQYENNSGVTLALQEIDRLARKTPGKSAELE